MENSILSNDHKLTELHRRNYTGRGEGCGRVVEFWAVYYAAVHCGCILQCGPEGKHGVKQQGGMEDEGEGKKCTCLESGIELEELTQD